MPRIPNLSDPRYLDEVGWFLYHEKYKRDHFGGSYNEERLAYSRMLLDEVLERLDRDRSWLENQTVVSIGCGCTGDLASWPVAVKIAVDPLLYTYQKLGMLLDDAPGTSRTIHLSVGVEDLPLLDDCADLVLCRNALDHMPDAEVAVKEIWRILKHDGVLYLSVDIGGSPTLAEPTVFSVESLAGLLRDRFEVLAQTDNHRPHSSWRDHSIRILATKKPRPSLSIDREKILQAYEDVIRATKGKA